jgi:hypothetical protein
MELHIFYVHTYFITSFGLTKVSVSKIFVLADPFWLRKATTNSYVLAHVNVECTDDRCPKIKKNYMSELILYSYEYIPVSYVTTHCMI